MNKKEYLANIEKAEKEEKIWINKKKVHLKQTRTSRLKILLKIIREELRRREEKVE